MTPPRRKSLPLGGKVARNAPDEGKMSDSRNKPTRIIAIAAKRQGIIGKNANFRQVCRGRIYASRAAYPVGCIARMVARAAYMPPLHGNVFCVGYGFPGRFVGNGLDRSVQFSRCIVISGWS